MAARDRIILESRDEQLCNQVLAEMAKARMHVSPTLVVAGFYIGGRPANDAPRVRMLPPEVHTALLGPDFRLDAMTDEVRALASDSIALDHRTFLMGQHDQTASPTLSRADSAHSPLFEERERATQILLQDVLRGTNSLVDVTERAGGPQNDVAEVAKSFSLFPIVCWQLSGNRYGRLSD